MNKKLFCGLVCFFFIITALTPAIADEQVKKKEKKKIEYGKIKDFKTFFSTLKQVAKEKNTDAFKQMMADEYAYTLGFDPDLKPGEKPSPETALRYMEKHKLWEQLNAILEKGYAESLDEGLTHYNSPPEAGRGGDYEYMGPAAGFVKLNGYWKILYFIGLEE